MDMEIASTWSRPGGDPGGPWAWLCVLPDAFSGQRAEQSSIDLRFGTFLHFAMGTFHAVVIEVLIGGFANWLSPRLGTHAASAS